MERFVVDTSVLYYGKDLPSDCEVVITPGVVRELENEDMGERLQLLLATRLRVLNPSRRSLDKVAKSAERTGDSRRLSRTDRELLALALDLGYQLLTDDYSIQNLAEVLGIPCKGVNQNGISRVLEWEARCVGCGKTFPADVEECDVCGSATKSTKKRKHQRT